MAENYRALPQITVNDKDVASEISENILQVVVEESLHRPSLFTLVVRNDYQSGGADDVAWNSDKQLSIGDTLSIGFTPSLTQAQSEDDSAASAGTLIKGEITSVEAHFSESTQAPMIMRGYDLSHRLHRGRFNRSFQNMTDSDVVKKIISQVDLSAGTIDDSGEPHAYLFQENQTNMEFLRSRAARIGFELFVQDGKLHFRKPTENDTLELKWLDTLRSFRVRVNSTEQVEEVEVRGWDYVTKKPVVANVKSEDLLTERDPKNTDAEQDKKRGSEINQVFSKLKDTPRMVVVDQPFFNPKEADILAQSVCNELGGQYVVADAKNEGNPQIRPGVIVELTGLGPYTGKYYVTDTRHTYAERLYTTEFSVRGLRSDDLFTTLNPAPTLRPGQTMLVGIVTDNEDPEGMGRVKVMFPTLTEEHTSNWARVVSMGAADGRGFDCLPEIDDEVLVAFEHGDIHRPYVLGGVWNGQDAPPNSPDKNVQGGQVRQRTFQTRVGHKLQFVEEDQDTKKGIYLHTQGGHQLSMNESEQLIEIVTQGKNRVVLNDASGSITLEATGTISIKAPGSVTVEGSGSVAVKGGGSVSIQGGTISLN